MFINEKGFVNRSLSLKILDSIVVIGVVRDTTLGYSLLLITGVVHKL
jgi:hypothetical protein